MVFNLTLAIALLSLLCGDAAAQSKGPAGSGSAYNVITPNNHDQTAQIQAALNNSMNVPVMLSGGIFFTSAELKVPPFGIFVGENGINYTPYVASVGSSLLRPSGSFSGTAVVGFNGLNNQIHGGVIRAINVDDDYQHFIDFNGYISGTTLTVTSIISNNLNPGLVPWMDLRDKTGAILFDTKVMSQTGGTTGGVGTYTVTPGQTLGSSGSPVEIGGVVHCFEHLANASFTTVEDLQANRCTGDGYNITGDGNQPGGQGGTGLIRPVIHGGLYQLNEGAGIRTTFVNTSFVSDVVIDRSANAASNANNSFNHQVDGDVSLNEGTGQSQGLRVEQDGACGLALKNSSSWYFSNFFSDTNRSGAICMNNASASFVGGGTFTRDSGTGHAAVVLLNSSSAILDGFNIGAANPPAPPPNDGWQYSIRADSTSGATGWLPAPVYYFDTTTQSRVQGSFLAFNTQLANLPPTVNLVSQGGTGFASGWSSGSGVSPFAVVTSGQTDPFSKTNAAKIVEDSTSNQHGSSQGIIVPDNNTYNCSVYYKALGVGAARDFAVSISGTTGSSYAIADPTGSIINAGVGGSGVSVGNSSNTTAGGGWIQLVVAASGLGPGIGSASIGMAVGGASTYLGDNTSGQFIYGPICVAGSIAP